MKRVPKENYNKYIQDSVIWRRKRKRVLIERGKRCEICQEATSRPQIHHLHYGNLGDEPMRDLQVLCAVCHKREHSLRDPDTFESPETLTGYIDKLDQVDANWRFPKYWIETEKWLERAKTSEKPPAVIVGVSADGLTMRTLPRPKVEPDKFAILYAADYKCHFCSKPLKHNTFHVSQGRASCGCDMVAAFMQKKELALAEK